MTQWDFQNKGIPTNPARLSFVLEVPPRHLRPSVIYSAPCDRILQRTYYGSFARSCHMVRNWLCWDGGYTVGPWCLSYHWSQVKSMMLSDWNHTFFIYCSASIIFANMHLEPSLVKEVANHKQNSNQTLAQPLHGIAKPKKKRCIHWLPGNLNRVNTGWKARFAPGAVNGGGWGV